MKVHKNTDDLHKEISELKDTLEGFKKLVEVQRKEILAEALGPCSSKLVERNIYLYRGSCITELVAQGLKLEPCCLGLEACASFLSKLGA
jgi:hypothetical protein